ncbi:MAG: citrate synthase [Acidimicrobiia bacterium]|nr:citrate synthase [Acidimicrobiia bacterium]
MTAATSTLVVPPGLRGVVVTDTAIGDVRGEEGRYHYRQYDAVRLAEARSFEDVWFLLREGRLPDGAEQAAFAATVARARRLDPALAVPLAAIAEAGGPLLDQLRSALSVAGARRGCRPLLDVDDETARDDTLALTALVPTLAAALYRLGRDQEPVVAGPSLGTVAAYLHNITGEDPGPGTVRALEQYLIATIDHGFNASTFTARVVASTGADVAACLVAGLAALSGPLHGGAPSRALELLDEVGDPARAGEAAAAMLERGERLMGFGHAVYRTDDPRSRLLHQVAAALGAERLVAAEQVEAAVLAALRRAKPDQRLATNVEFYAGVVLEAIGLPAELFTATFAVSRAVGWSAHLLEQRGEGRIVRPAARYIGPEPFADVPSV